MPGQDSFTAELNYKGPVFFLHTNCRELSCIGLPPHWQDSQCFKCHRFVQPIHHPQIHDGHGSWLQPSSQGPYLRCSHALRQGQYDLRRRAHLDEAAGNVVSFECLQTHQVYLQAHDGLEEQTERNAGRLHVHVQVGKDEHFPHFLRSSSIVHCMRFSILFIYV